MYINIKVLIHIKGMTVNSKKNIHQNGKGSFLTV